MSRPDRKKFRTNYLRTPRGWRWQITGYYAGTLLRSGVAKSSTEARKAVLAARAELNAQGAAKTEDVQA